MGLAARSQPIVSTGAMMAERISCVREYTRSQLVGGVVGRCSSLTFWVGWRRGFFAGAVVSSCLILVVFVEALRLRLRVAFGAYFSLDVDGGSESSESDSSSFLFFAILVGGVADWWRYCSNVEKLVRSEPIDGVGETMAISLERRDVRIVL